MKDTEYKDLPILSAGAPFKAGGRNGSNYYTNISAGDLAIKTSAICTCMTTRFRSSS